MISVKNDGGTPDDVVFHELMEIAVCLVEYCEECVVGEIIEEVEQREAGNTNAVLEHVNITVAVESELFLNRLEERGDVTVIVPYEIVTHCLHPVIAPHRLTSCVIIVGDAFILEATEEDRLWR